MADPKNPIETIEFITAMLQSWKTYQDISADGKVNLLDLPAVFSAAPTLWKGFVGLDNIDNELLVIDEEGRAKIKAKIEEFVLVQDPELEDLVEDIVQLVLNMTEVAAKTVQYFKD